MQIAADGAEVARFPSIPLTGDNGSPVPFDSPSGIAFRGTSLIVANQSALLGNAANMALLDVEVGEEGQPEFIPPNAGPVDIVVAGAALGCAAASPRAAAGRVPIRLSRGVRGAPARVRLTAGGRTLASGTLRGRTLRVVTRSAASLPKRVTLRGTRLRATALTLGR